VFDWQVLRAHVVTYAAGTDAATILADLTSPADSVDIDVPASRVQGLLYARGKWAAVVVKANAARAGTDTSDAAIACQLIKDLVDSGQTISMSNAAIAQRITADVQTLIVAGLLDAEDASAVLLLASHRPSWAEANGWPGLSLGQVQEAMRPEVI
jgi:hypothetical protein